MGKCQFCGKDAGLLRNIHKECKQANEDGKSQILNIIKKIGQSGTNLSTLQETINGIALSSYIDSVCMKTLLINGWEEAVFEALEDNVLSEEEEDALVAFKDHFSLSTDSLDKNGAYSRIVKAAILRDILEGNVPQRVNVEGKLPFNFQKGETLVWLSQNVEYYEPRTKTTYSGSSSGVSIKVAKGLYYRVGGFKGNPVVTTQNTLIDIGSLAFTDKHIYFQGDKKAFRIKYDKVMAFVPYSDGIGVQRDSMSAKLQIFVDGDGWFTYNMAVNLAHLN